MQNLLVATDFSQNSDRTLQYALELAVQNKFNVFLFHDPQLSIPSRTPANLLEDLKKGYQTEYTEKMKEQFEKVTQETKISFDIDKLKYIVSLDDAQTFQKINTAIDANAIDLVFTGTRNLSGIKRFFLGSTALQLMQSANCPVFAVPQKGKHVKIEEIVFASDLTDLNDGVYDVIKFAKFFNAELFILHVSEVNTTNVNLDAVVENIKKKANYDKIRLEIINSSSDNAEEKILEYLRKETIIDLLVMFPEKKGYFDRIFGVGHTGNILSEINIPLLAFHHKIKS